MWYDTCNFMIDWLCLPSHCLIRSAYWSIHQTAASFSQRMTTGHVLKFSGLYMLMCSHTVHKIRDVSNQQSLRTYHQTFLTLCDLFVHSNSCWLCDGHEMSEQLRGEQSLAWSGITVLTIYVNSDATWKAVNVISP